MSIPLSRREYKSLAPEVSEIRLSQEKFKIVDPQLEQDTSRSGQTIGVSGAKLVGTTLDNKIQIESLIGQGGMSVVYRGTHLVLNRPVAIKVILPGLGFNDKAVLRLQQEAKAAYSLAHENLASVHDVSVTSEGLPYLVMDFAGGETLAEMLKRGPLEPSKAIEIFAQICAGLRAAHAQGVIHRDIKPGNIMVEHLADGRELVKIVDFGIAKKVTENSEEIQKLTQTGEVFGTPLYMSPEQCRGDKLDDLSDIYSLGCVFYEALTGAPPFKGESSIATILLHLGKETPTPGKDFNLPAPLVSVLHRCLEKSSKNRYQSMDELYKDLQAIKEGGKTAKKYVKKSHVSKPVKVIAALALSSFAVAMFFVLREAGNQIFNYEYGYETVAACNAKLAKNPDEFKAYALRANLNMGQQQWAKAVADYTDCIRLTKAPADVYAYRAQAYIQLRKYKEAVADCNSALALEPHHMAALQNRAMAYGRLQKYDQSLADANVYLQKNPSDVSMLGRRARDLIALGRYKEAIDDCTLAIKIDPTNSQPFADRARAYNSLHKNQDAIADATEAIKLNRDPAAYTELACAQLSLHQYDKALENAQTALQLEPSQPLALTLKAEALGATGKPEEALVVCNKGLSHYPTFAPMIQARAWVYSRLGKLDLAQQDLEKLKTMGSQKPTPAAVN
jgi:serine/threonine protein kinase/Flp pilus assembly protein TadD